MRTIDLATISAAERRRLTRRTPVTDPVVREQARAIVEAIRDGGDSALTAASRKYGGGPASGAGTLATADFAGAVDRINPALLQALEEAAAAIGDVHRAQLPTTQSVSPVEGVDVERQWTPLRRVGIYAPGGLSPYPSSVLMAAVPARLAGVPEVVVASPAGPSGVLGDAVLAACAVGGVSEVHVMGGAQAIGALAYGTETIAPVDKIVGPGNAWVTAAKIEVFGVCAIDLPAGPSEAMEIVDESAATRAVAADLISQAEHGPDSIAVLVALNPDVAEAVDAEVATLLAQLDRAEIIRESLERNSYIVVAADRTDACSFANEFAPEHLGIHTRDAEAIAAAVTSAGSVFVGHFSPHSAGDYATGANHVLPTGGLARSNGPLSVEDFGSYRQIQRITRDGLRRLQPTVSALASAEGLTAHRLAVDIRFEDSP
jgi:histidinol dehydrogenase